MEINNIELVKQFINPISEDDFWFLQILRRKKENPDNGSNSTVIATYYIHSIEHLDKVFEEMKILSRFHRARVYINLNRRNYEQLGLQMIKKVSDCLINKAYKDIKNAYDSICGSFHVEKEKKWIVDIDDNHDSIAIHHTNQRVLYSFIEELGGIVYQILPTLNGVHWITSPFSTMAFGYKIIGYNLANPEMKCPIPDIQKNNPTLLYYSDDAIVTMPENWIEKFS